jgi:hypothetical protein
LDVDGTRSDIGAYGGPGGESYVYLDLAPLVPGNIEFNIGDNYVIFNWNMNLEADFNRYLVFRDTVSGFDPSLSNLISEPDTSHFIDSLFFPGTANYYRFASVDNQDNLSDYSGEIEVIMTDLPYSDNPDLPEKTGIVSNYPNPFNSNTTIIYHVGNFGPVPAQIDIGIYDILGRKVRTLLSDRKEVGNYKIIWDGRDDSGDELQTGVYFVRISQWNTPVLTRIRKVTLLK